MPDSQFAKSAIAYAEQLCPDYMIRHCFRSYCFGAVLASRNKLKLDREVFFVAAMLHDLGLSPAHAEDSGSFEWVGAKLAYQFSKDSDQSEAFATTVHNAIALHTSVGIAGKQAPELALLHYATGMDLFGMRLDEIPRIILEEILVRYPRDRFKAQFCTCLSHQAQIKPNSQIAAAIGIGITDQILEQLA
jgi:HD superfamily phosphodiesterase